MENNRKFYVLDALRGIAALAVVQLHTSRFFGRQIWNHAGLAVDFFFMLSGFVLSFAYQKQLDTGWTTGNFLKTRLIRLYPLYFLGLVLGIMYWLLYAHFGHGPKTPGFGLFVFFGLLLLPVPPGFATPGGFAFPFNLPTWSLFCEIFANVLHAIVGRRRSLMALSIFTALSAIALIATIEHFQTVDIGDGQVSIYYGLTRLLFAYTAGILVYFLWKKYRLRTNISPFIPALLLLALLAGPLNGPVAYDLTVMIVLFPVLLFLGACSTPSNALIPTTHWMGVTSYAIYVLHIPLASFFELIWNRTRKHNISLDAPWGGVLFIVLMIFFAVTVDRFYDLRVRKFLRRTLP